MKHISTFIFAVFIAIAFHSCKKDDTSVGKQTSTNGYESAAQATETIDALYRMGAPTFFGENNSADGPLAAAGSLMAGFIENESADQTDFYEHCRQLTMNQVNSANYIEAVWGKATAAIDSATEAIARTDATSGLTDKQKRALIGEARFFRAFNRFYLARAFGMDTYDLIVADLEEAIPYLPDMSFATNGFRVTRAAAQTLLADVYLTMSGYPLRKDHYRQAAETARAVIKSGRHNLIGNGETPEKSAYNILRTEQGNQESIYAYHAGSSFASLSLPEDAANWSVVKMKTGNSCKPSAGLLGFYDPVNDLRVAEKQFFHTFFKYEKSGRTIIQTFSPQSYLWYNENALLGTGAAQHNIMIYRYAEVLLIAAEAIAASEGVTAEAAGYLADVRSRAMIGSTAAETADKLASLPTAAFIEEVWKERVREFPLEMKAWTDIQRTRKYPVLTDDSMDVVFMDVVGAHNAAGAVFTAKHLLLPTPAK